MRPAWSLRMNGRGTREQIRGGAEEPATRKSGECWQDDSTPCQHQMGLHRALLSYCVAASCDRPSHAEPAHEPLPEADPPATCMALFSNVSHQVASELCACVFGSFAQWCQRDGLGADVHI
jgi:hypothetical protein